MGSGIEAQAVGTIVVAHGGDSIWNALVREIARQVRSAGPVEVSFLMGPEAHATRFQDAVASLVREGAREVVAVPLLVSSHSGHYEQIRYLAGHTDTLDAVMREHLHQVASSDQPARCRFVSPLPWMTVPNSRAC